MNKRILSTILSVALIVTMLTFIPVSAKSDNIELPIIVIESDKEIAFRGENITYTIYLQQPDTITCFGFNVAIPKGLTFSESSVVLGETATKLFGENFKLISPSETIDPSKAFPLLSWFSASAEDFTDKSKIELLKFKCTVDDDAKLDNLYEVNLTNIEMMAGSTQDYADISNTVSVTPHFAYVASTLPFVPSPNKPSSGSQNQGTDTPSTNVPENDEPKPVTPDTSNSPYTDVAEGAYYYAPVIWAAESGYHRYISNYIQS